VEHQRLVEGEDAPRQGTVGGSEHNLEGHETGTG
jgi:hypothetical protein